jgi:hypothetical protein
MIQAVAKLNGLFYRFSGFLVSHDGNYRFAHVGLLKVNG